MSKHAAALDMGEGLSDFMTNLTMGDIDDRITSGEEVELDQETLFTLLDNLGPSGGSFYRQWGLLIHRVHVNSRDRASSNSNTYRVRLAPLIEPVIG